MFGKSVLTLRVLLAVVGLATMLIPSVSGQTATVDSVVTEDGAKILFDYRGNSEKALVFVHCWCCDRSFWDGQVDEFAPEYLVVTVDLAGHGQSGGKRADWTIPLFGADVAAVVNELDLKQVILIGHSMGGPVIIEAARLLGDRVVCLIGIDNFLDFSRIVSRDQISGFLTDFEQDFKPRADQFVRKSFTSASDPALVNRVADQLSSASPQMGVSALANTIGYDYKTAFETVRVPVRAISTDRIVTNFEFNRRVTVSFEAKIMSGAGHFMHMDDPAAFNMLLRETITEFWPVK